MDYYKVYATKEIATHLDIGESTLRKWSMALERHGYEFKIEQKEKQAVRLYKEQDIFVLRELQALLKDKKNNLENASKIVYLKHFPSNNTTDIDVVRSASAQEERLVELVEHITLKLDDIQTGHKEEIKEYVNKQMEDLKKDLMEYIAVSLAENKKQYKAWWKLW